MLKGYLQKLERKKHMYQTIQILEAQGGEKEHLQKQILQKQEFLKNSPKIRIFHIKEVGVYITSNIQVSEIKILHKLNVIKFRRKKARKISQFKKIQI